LCKFSAEDFDLLIRKGAYSFEYVVDCVEKLNERCLPPRELFYNSLIGDTISESDYAHAPNVRKWFFIRTLGEYSNRYLKTDVLLLADFIFKNFRNSCVCKLQSRSRALHITWFHVGRNVKTYAHKIWVAHWHWCGHVYRARYTWWSQSMFRYVQANNKYMLSYDSSKLSSYWYTTILTIYMSERYVNHCNTPNVDRSETLQTLMWARLLRIRSLVTFSRSISNIHTSARSTHWSAFLSNARGIKPLGKRNKQRRCIYNKQCYVIYYRNLQQCTRHDLRVTKIHWILQLASPCFASALNLIHSLECARKTISKKVYTN